MSTRVRKEPCLARARDSHTHRLQTTNRRADRSAESLDSDSTRRCLMHQEEEERNEVLVVGGMIRSVHWSSMLLRLLRACLCEHLCCTSHLRLRGVSFCFDAETRQQVAFPTPIRRHDREMLMCLYHGKVILPCNKPTHQCLSSYSTVYPPLKTGAVNRTKVTVRILWSAGKRTDKSDKECANNDAPMRREDHDMERPKEGEECPKDADDSL